MVAHEKRNSAQLFCAVPTRNDLALSSLLFPPTPHKSWDTPFPQSAGLVGQQKGFPVGSPFECACALQRPQKLRLQVPATVQRRGDLRQQRLPVAVQCALQRQIVAGMVGAEHGSFAVHVL